MLGLPIEVHIDIEHKRFPLHFEHKNTCIHCGANGSLVFVDKFGNTSTKETSNAFEHIRCEKCGRIYSMKWEPMENDPNVYKPSAVEFNIKQDFKNLIDANIYHRGEKSLD